MECYKGPEVPQEEDQTTTIDFETLSEPMQEKIYDYIEKLGLDEGLAHYVKYAVVKHKSQQDITFLQNLSDLMNQK
jgi:hypothetical protein